MKQNQKKRNGVLLAVAVAAGALGLTACTAAVPETVKVQNAERQVISVNSSEQVKVDPDMAEVVYSVYSQASDAQTCQTQNGTDLTRVLEILKGLGVEETSIQTSNFGMNPIYDWEDGKNITGYEMTTQVTVSDIAIDGVGALLSDSVDAGVNTIDSVSYLSSKYEEAYQEALKKAVASAKVKAQAMAEAGGCKLGGIVNIQEAYENQAAKYTSRNSTAGMSMTEEASVMDMAVMPGQLEIEANISVEFSIE